MQTKENTTKFVKFMAGTIFQSIRELNAGDHLCCIYQTDEEHRRLISEYVRLGLEEKQKNLFIIDTDTAQTVIESLESIGIDAKAHQNSGRLSFLSRQERFTSGGQFVPEAMVELIRSETRKALEEGFSALRITNEMAWILPEPTDPEQLLEYENKLNHFISGQPCIALGLYDKRYFSPSILMNVLRTHPEAVIGTEVFENFYYLPPEKLLGDKPSVSELDLWINNLREYSTAHQALQDSEERYRNLYNSLRDAILVADTERTIIHCNQAFTDLFGYTLEEVRGKKTQYVYSNDGEFQELGERLQRTDEEEFQYTIHYRKKDGSTFPGETKIFAFKDSRNTTTGYIGMIRDVTEQLRMENELKREQRIVEAILETSGALILSIDSEGTIERANQSCEEITGYTEQDLKTISIMDLVPESEREEVKRVFNDLLNGVFPATHENHWTTKNGEKRYIAWTNTVVQDRSGNIESIISTGIDITEQKEEMESRLKQLEAEIAGMENFSSPGSTSVTGRMYAQRPFQEASPEDFSAMREEYQGILEDRLDEKIHKTDNHISSRLHFLAEQLGRTRVGPKDVVELHTTALKTLNSKAPYKRAQALTEEGRLLALELMGYLVSFYRNQTASENGVDR